MIIDAHAHVYSPDEARYPPIESPLRPPAGTGSPEHLRREMDSAGVDRVMMVQTSTFYGWDNSFVRAAWRRYREWAGAVYTLDPEDPHSSDVLFSMAERGGMRALRTYPVGGHADGRYDHPGNLRLWEAARENGVVVNVLISHPRYASELSDVLEDYPDVPAVLDHCIALDIREAEFGAKLAATVELAAHSNLNAKLTFLATGSAEEHPFRDMHDAARQIIDAYGPDRCLWGSDFPTALWAPRTTYTGYLQLFRQELGLSASEKDAILGGTAERLYFS